MCGTTAKIQLSMFNTQEVSAALCQTSVMYWKFCWWKYSESWGFKFCNYSFV